MRLIDADRFEVVLLNGKSDEFCDGAEYILEMIDNAPTVDIKTEVAREIFAEIEKITALRSGFNEKTITAVMDFEKLKQLKNKYTKEVKQSNQEDFNLYDEIKQSLNDAIELERKKK